MRLVGLLVVGAIVLFLSVKELQKNGPQSPAITNAIQRSQDVVAATNLRAAATELSVSFASNGTYAGAAIDVAGVALVSADTTSYCVQTSPPAAVEHLTGPNGTPQPGTC